MGDHLKRFLGWLLVAARVHATLRRGEGGEPVRATHTYAILEISAAAYSEISRKLKDAGYDHAFGKDSTYGEVIDLHGIAVASEPPAHPNRTSLTGPARANQKESA